MTAITYIMRTLSVDGMKIPVEDMVGGVSRGIEVIQGCQVICLVFLVGGG